MKKKGGFTLMEVLIAMSLFTVAAVISTSVLVDVVQLQKKSSIQNSVYQDARVIMQQLTNMVQSGTIDYEEYYSMNVVQQVQKTLGTIPVGGPYYGVYYGVYGSRFFDPGKSLKALSAKPNPDNLGIECSYPKDGDKGYDVTKNCEIYYTESTDLNTGQNPYKGNTDNLDGTKANAFCDEYLTNSITCSGVSGIVNELYLIDSSGTHKTILGLKGPKNKDSKKPNNCDDSDPASNCSIAMMKMTGRDLDQNGVMDVFSCDEEYSCVKADDSVNKIVDAFKYPFIAGASDPKALILNNKISLPQQSDLGGTFDLNKSQFLPITPSRVTVKYLSFKINPLDDPYKAYIETAMRTQPTVTITMTLGLSSTAKNDYPGNFPDITLQTTVAAGVVGKIDSYPPVNDILRKDGDLSWINAVYK